jgi:cytochrome b involved in lipid metabolism
MKKFTKEEVSKHNTAEDHWVIINSRVYDLTKFSKVHPGGK